MVSQTYELENRRTYHCTVMQKVSIGGGCEDSPTFTGPKQPFTNRKRETFCSVHGALHFHKE